MAIKKIKIGSTTYDINDVRNVVIGNGVDDVVVLTGAQYDALATKDPNTIYLVTDRNVPASSGGGGGGIEDVTLGGSSVVSNGVAVLPAYPTTLPASDVSSWAKASSKPSYTATEVGALSGVTFNGVSATVTSGVAAITATIPTVPTISTSITSDATSDTKTASPKAVKTYVDGIVGDIETLLAAI